MQLNNCVCPGDVLIYECTIAGGGATLWKGSAFDCPSVSNEIILRHSEFESENGNCNNEAITADSIGSTMVRNNLTCYTSRLNVTVSNEMNSRTIKCIHDSIDTTVVGMATIVFTTGKNTTLSQHINICVSLSILLGIFTVYI